LVEETVSFALPRRYEQISITGDCAANGDVTLNVGDVKSCTITNRVDAIDFTVKVRQGKK
jgi:hypothetical protein